MATAGGLWGCMASMPTASIARSVPMPPVRSRIVSTTSSSSKLIVSAPFSRAFWSRESMQSTASTRPGPHQQGADDGELPDRPAAEDRHRVAGMDVGQVRAEVAGREDVRDHQRLLVRDRVRNLDHPDVGEGHPRHLRLQAVDRAGRFGPAEKAGARLRAVRVGVVALREVARPAVRAVAAGNRGGDHHAIPFDEVPHVAARVLHDPDALVAEDRARLHARHRAADHVQVRAADGRARQADDGVVGVLDLGLRNVVQPNIADIMVYNCFHSALLES